MSRAGKIVKQPAPEAIARAFERFATGGYPPAKLTESLYRALSHSFLFIAHFDRGGFYEARFADLGGRVETLETIVAPTPWTPTPAEIAIRAVVVERGLLEAAVLARDVAVEATERAELARLKAKYDGAES
jgi:hypothetical protein